MKVCVDRKGKWRMLIWNVVREWLLRPVMMWLALTYQTKDAYYPMSQFCTVLCRRCGAAAR